MEDRSQEARKHVFAINGSPAFLNVIREVFQEEGYNVTTTNFVPASFDQIVALRPDALIVMWWWGIRLAGSCWSGCTPGRRPSVCPHWSSPPIGDS